MSILKQVANLQTEEHALVEAVISANHLPNLNEEQDWSAAMSADELLAELDLGS